MKSKLSQEEVRRIADLARIELTENEKEKYAEELSSVLGYFEQLKEVKTEGVELTSQVTGLVNVAREDIVEGCDKETKKKLLDAAPMREGDYIKVKAVM